MEIKEMDVKQLEERKAAIATEVDNEGADLEALAAEVKSINEELEARKAEESKRVEIREAVANGAGKVDETMVVRVIEAKEDKVTMRKQRWIIWKLETQKHILMHLQMQSSRMTETLQNAANY